MQYICGDCGEIFDEFEAGSREEPHGEVEGCVSEYFAICPNCGSDNFCEVCVCDECGKEFPKVNGEYTSNFILCEDCHKKAEEIADYIYKKYGYIREAVWEYIYEKHCEVDA